MGGWYPGGQWVDGIMEQQVCHPAHECRKRPPEAFFAVAEQATRGIRSQDDTANLDDT
jgi:hypothetical protein